MTPDLITAYHETLSPVLWYPVLKRVDSEFRVLHRIDRNDPIMPHLAAVFEAHKLRVAGKSSPAACDDIANQERRKQLTTAKSTTYLIGKRGSASASIPVRLEA